MVKVVSYGLYQNIINVCGHLTITIICSFKHPITDLFLLLVLKYAPPFWKRFPLHNCGNVCLFS